MTATPTESTHDRDVWLPASARLATPDTKASRVTQNDDLAIPPPALFRLPGDDASPERDALYQTIREQTAHLERLTAQVEHFMHRQRELRTLLLEAQQQLLQRDAELEQIRARHLTELDARTSEVTSRLYGEILQREAATAELRTWSLGQIQDLTGQLERSREQLQAFRSGRWWRLRLFIKRVSGL